MFSRNVGIVRKFPERLIIHKLTKEDQTVDKINKL